MPRNTKGLPVKVCQFELSQFETNVLREHVCASQVIYLNGPPDNIGWLPDLHTVWVARVDDVGDEDDFVPK